MFDKSTKTSNHTEANENNTIKYFLYARKSSEAEDKQVASIESQIDELTVLANKNGLQIIEIYKENKSALKLGRPVFNKMLQDISKGKANGILCWKLNRLARNFSDGGNIIHLLQTSAIKQIHTFSKIHLPSDDVLPIAIEFGMANQYSRDLTVDTMRGQRSKIKDGWLPHKPPVGYLNNTYNKSDKDPIYPDPLSFQIMLELWNTLLTKRCTIDELYKTAEEKGLKNSRGGKISRTNFYRLFRNPFYYGAFVWNKEIFEGKHQPMISKSQFELAQTILDLKSNPRASTHSFAFTGLIRCGECGASITAEEKDKVQKNGNKHHYTYYRCTKRINKNCSQMPISLPDLEKQIADTLSRISIPPQFHRWAIKQLKNEHQEEQKSRDKITVTYRRNLDNCIRQLDALLNMRMSNEITSEEYSNKKESVMSDKHKYEELLGDTQGRIDGYLKHAEETLSFAETARKRFELGSLEDKHYILSCLGTNLILKDKHLKIEFNKSLAMFQEVAEEIKVIHERLEPAKTLAKQVDLDNLYTHSKKWGG